MSLYVDKQVTLETATLSLIAVLGLILIVSLWPTLHAFWVSSAAYSHGYLVVGIAIWLAVREVRRAPLGSFEPSLVGLGILLLVLSVALSGHAADVLILQQLAFPAIPIAVLWSVAGWPTARRFLVPAVYCVFAISIWDAINEPLRALTTIVVSQLTYLSSIPAFIDGNTIRIPSGTFEIEGGCSGLRYLIAAGALSVLYGLLSYGRWSRRFALLGLAVLIALLANWIRVFVIIVAGHLTDMQHYLVTVDHVYFGWILFFLMTLPIFFIFHPDQSSTNGDSIVVHAEVSSRFSNRIVTFLTILVLGSAVWASAGLIFRPDPLAGDGRLSLPQSSGDWVLGQPWEDEGTPRFANSFRHGSGWYRRDGDLVGLFIADYPVQRQGYEVVFYANLPAGSQAEIASEAIRGPETLNGEIALTELEVTDADSGRRLIWYGYQVAGLHAGDELTAKLYQVIGALRRRWDAQVWVASSDCHGRDCERARELLGGFVKEVSPHRLVIPPEDVRSPGNES